MASAVNVTVPGLPGPSKRGPPAEQIGHERGAPGPRFVCGGVGCEGWRPLRRGPGATKWLVRGCAEATGPFGCAKRCWGTAGLRFQAPGGDGAGPRGRGGRTTTGAFICRLAVPVQCTSVVCRGGGPPGGGWPVLGRAARRSQGTPPSNPYALWHALRARPVPSHIRCAPPHEPQAQSFLRPADWCWRFV